MKRTNVKRENTFTRDTEFAGTASTEEAENFFSHLWLSSFQWAFQCWSVSELCYRICESRVRCKIVIVMCLVVFSIFATLAIIFSLFIFLIFLALSSPLGFCWFTLTLSLHPLLSLPSCVLPFLFGDCSPPLWTCFYFSSLCFPNCLSPIYLEVLLIWGSKHWVEQVKDCQYLIPSLLYYFTNCWIKNCCNWTIYRDVQDTV